jgi:hypothetical protein
VLPGGEDFERVAAKVLDVLSPRAWALASGQTRSELAVQACRVVAGEWNVRSVVVSVQPLAASIGRYDPATNSVVLGGALMSDRDCGETVATIAHELRHAVQQLAMKDPDRHPLGADGRDEVARWRAAENAYDADKDDFTAYAYNALEADAFGAELEVVAAYWKSAYERYRRRFWQAG